MKHDFPIVDLGFLLAANRSRAYRERTKARFVSLSCFLNDYGLCKKELPCDEEKLEPKARIMASELTEEGLAVMRASLDKWLRAQDRGKPPSDVSILLQGLKKVRK